MKIFCIGLSRTGTFSLHHALMQLGYSSKHWDYTKNTLIEVNGALAIDANKYEKFDAYLDTPVARFYKELDEAYPGSKFILTERNIEDWYLSYKSFFPEKPAADYGKVSLHLEIYGTYSHDERLIKSRFRNHCLEVKRYFQDRPEDLLCLTIGAGGEWEKLCGFLCRGGAWRGIPVDQHQGSICSAATK